MGNESVGTAAPAECSPASAIRDGPDPENPHRLLPACESGDDFHFARAQPFPEKGDESLVRSPPLRRRRHADLEAVSERAHDLGSGSSGHDLDPELQTVFDSPHERRQRSQLRGFPVVSRLPSPVSRRKTRGRTRGSSTARRRSSSGIAASIGFRQAGSVRESVSR